jgi:hypothetical protein
MGACGRRDAAGGGGGGAADSVWRQGGARRAGGAWRGDGEGWRGECHACERFRAAALDSREAHRTKVVWSSSQLSARRSGSACGAARTLRVSAQGSACDVACQACGHVAHKQRTHRVRPPARCGAGAAADHGVAPERRWRVLRRSASAARHTRAAASKQSAKGTAARGAWGMRGGHTIRTSDERVQRRVPRRTTHGMRCGCDAHDVVHAVRLIQLLSVLKHGRGARDGLAALGATPRIRHRQRQQRGRARSAHAAVRARKQQQQRLDGHIREAHAALAHRARRSSSRRRRRNSCCGRRRRRQRRAVQRQASQTARQRCSCGCSRLRCW